MQRVISVAISGATAIGGAWGDDGNGATSAGSAYIFHGLGDYDENGIIDICDIDFDGPTDTPVRGLVFRDLNFTHGDRGVVTKTDASIQHDWEMYDKSTALIRFRATE